MQRRDENIPGYQIVSLLYKSADTLVYRAMRESDQYPVILKILKQDHLALVAQARAIHEYEMIRRLHGDHVIKAYALESYQNNPMLVLEDSGGEALCYVLAKGHPTITPISSILDFLALATQIVNGLAGIHAAGVIHKDLNPANMVFNTRTGQLTIIDFGLATTLSRETPALKNPHVLEGTLAYLSPEQTGRMNRTVDYRTDFYALGVTFYELLTGQLPFAADDPMELVHFHLARTPVTPHRLNPDLPTVISDLILKLMAKAPEDRYQSTRGIKHDLDVCWQFWQTQAHIPVFALGQHDPSDHFMIPEKLYGRTAEVAALLAAFERVARGHTEIVLVNGSAGIGKTALVNEVHKPIVQQRGYFMRGKFDQFKRNIPFSAFIQAFSNLIEQLLDTPNAQRQQWQSNILSAVGELGQVIIDVIPDLERIIGPQPAVPELPGTAAQHRLHVLLQKFIQVFASPQHPLVIFLDDLQWADAASLHLLQLLSGETRIAYLLLLGAYRDNEISATHPLMLMLHTLTKHRSPLTTLTPEPLLSSDINHLIADTLNCTPDLASPLTSLVYQKTRGNPFFVRQFLKSLYNEGLITFDPAVGYWQCDLASVSVRALSEDVVAFMAIQLQKLPLATQEILQVAACIGNQFDLDMLAIVRRQSPGPTAADVWQAVQAGFVFPLSKTYSFFSERNCAADMITARLSLVQTPVYRFLHDRVQQAAYSLIPEAQRPAIHLMIGRLYLANTPEGKLEEYLFEIVNQLNAGLMLIDDPSERQSLAQLNLQAGRKARSATAYTTAIDYFTVGLNLLPTNCWQSCYALALSLHQDLAEVAYFIGDFAQMEQRVAQVLQQATSLLDRVKVYEIQILSMVAQNELKAALQLGLEVLHELGITFPDQPGSAEIKQTFQDVQTALAGQPVSALLDLPLMTNPVSLAAMRIMLSVGAATYLVAPPLFPLLIARQLLLSIADGNTAMSVYAYVSYGTLLCGIVEDVENGYAFGQLALSLLTHLHASELHARTCFMYYVFIHHWQATIAETLASLHEGYQRGIETGDLQFATFCIVHHISNAYFIGQELPTLATDIALFRAAVYNLHQESPYNYAGICQQAVLNLLGTSQHPCLLVGDACDEEYLLLRLQQTGENNSLHSLYLHKTILCYLFGEYAQAVEYANRAKHYIADVPGMAATVAGVVTYFYDSLVRLAIYADCDPIAQAESMHEVELNQAKLHRWAARAPMNYQHKYDLVEAERYRVLEDRLAAMDWYDQAIAGAKKHGYGQEEALANELAARFYLAWGKTKLAQVYLHAAYDLYSQWGARAKVDQLQQQYTSVLVPDEIGHPHGFRQSGNHASIRRSTDRTDSVVLDLVTVIKASQALAGEIELEHLLKKMIRIVIENAGAQRGALILERARAWVIEAHGDVDSPDINVLQALDLRTYALVSPVLVDYVVRTRERIVLDDAATDGNFMHDPYIQHNNIKSVMCFPLVNQGQLNGIVYLENNLTTGAFTTERVELLNLLAAQMAVSLNNATLYSHLEEKVAERTRSLAAAKEAAEVANQSKSAFLSSMSHELRTPLSAILGYAQILQRHVGSNDRLSNGLKIIHQSGTHLLALINDLLDLAKIEAGKIELTPVSLHLPTFLTGIIEVMRTRAEASGLPLYYQALSDLPEHVLVDERRLQQILLNLLSNAIKFTHQGHVTLMAECLALTPITAGQAQATIRFMVEDTGIGIAPAELERIFLPFEQAGDAHTQTEGTGLGLAINQQILALMGSTLQVVSKPDHGSSFWFEVGLPVVETDRTHMESPLAISGYQGPRRTVLVVDDNANNRQLLVDMLTPLGFDVILAENGEQAIMQALAKRPDLVLMDLVMPGQTGIEVIQAMRQHALLQDLVIIAISASVPGRNQDQGQVAGSNAFLSRPIQRSYLLALLEQHLGLMWVVGASDPDTSVEEDGTDDLIVPPHAEIEALYELVRRGNLRRLAEQASRLETLSPQYAHFARTVSRLAQRFDEQGLLAMLKPYL